MTLKQSTKIDVLDCLKEAIPYRCNTQGRKILSSGILHAYNQITGRMKSTLDCVTDCARVTIVLGKIYKHYIQDLFSEEHRIETDRAFLRNVIVFIIGLLEKKLDKSELTAKDLIIKEISVQSKINEFIESLERDIKMLPPIENSK